MSSEKGCKNSGLQIKYNEWGQMKMLFLFLVTWMDIGTSAFVVVGGFAPGGLNVNNNYYENNGVAGLRKSCYFPTEL